MKKILLTLLLTFLMILFTACGSTKTDNNSTASTNSQETITQEATTEPSTQPFASYVGTYEYVIPAKDENGTQETYRISLNNDGTFLLIYETYDYWKTNEEDRLQSANITGTYIQESSQWLILTGDKMVYKDEFTGEEKIELIDEGETVYIYIEDTNTILIPQGPRAENERPSLDDVIKLTRI